MALIKKLISGNKVESLEQEVQQLYANATPEQQELMKALAETAVNYQGADNMTASNTRRLRYEMLSKMKDIALGKTNVYSETNTNYPKKNVFGFYNKDEVNSIVNKLTKDTLNQNTQSSNTQISSNNTLTQSEKPEEYYFYKWDSHLYDKYNQENLNEALNNTSLQERGKYLTDALIASFSDLLTNSKGKNLQGIKESELEKYQSNLAKLQQLNWDDPNNAENNYKILKDISLQSQVDLKTFNDLFPEYNKLEENPQQNIIDAGYTSYSGNDELLKNKISDLGYLLFLKDGLLYAFDKDNNLVTSYGNMFTDFTDNAFGKGLFIKDGKVYFGDLNTMNNSDYLDLWNSTLEKVRNDNDRLYTEFNYGSDYNEYLNKLFSQFPELKNNKFRFSDFSENFRGNDIYVLAQLGENENPNDNPFNMVDLRDRYLFIFDKNEGIWTKSTFDKAKDLYGYLYKPYNLEASGQFTTYQPVYRINDKYSNITINDLSKTEMTDKKDKERIKNPISFANYVLLNINAKQNAGVSRFFRDLGDNNIIDPKLKEENGKLRAIKTLIYMYNTGLLKELDSDKIGLLKQLAYSSDLVVESLKKGGILKFKEGGYSTSYKSDRDYIAESKERAAYKHALASKLHYGNEEVYDKSQKDSGLFSPIKNKDQYDEKQLASIKATDILRATSIAADITSMFAALAPGAGTVTSAVTGVGSTVANFAADITQDGFQWRDLGNMGMNLGLDLVGLVPGFGATAKASKIAKSLKVILPSILTAMNLFDLGKNVEYYLESMKKVTTNRNEATLQDWKNVADALSLIAGNVRFGKGAIRNRRAKKNALTKKSVTYDLEVKKNGKTEKIQISEELAKQLKDEPDLAKKKEILKKIDPNAELITDKKGKWLGLGKKQEVNKSELSKSSLNPEDYYVSENEKYAKYRGLKKLKNFGENYNKPTPLDYTTGNIGWNWSWNPLKLGLVRKKDFKIGSNPGVSSNPIPTNPNTPPIPFNLKGGKLSFNYLTIF